MRKYLTLFLLMSASSVHGQLVSAGESEKVLKNQLNISVYSREVVIETYVIHRFIAETYFKGFLYERRFRRNVSGIFGAAYREMSIDDSCSPYCYDAPSGTGQFRELSVFLGGKFTLKSYDSDFITPLLESKLYYSRSSYYGIFEGGGWGPGRVVIDNKYDKIGLALSVGVEFLFLHRISITHLYSIKYLKRFPKSRYMELTDMAQIRIGTKF